MLKTESASIFYRKHYYLLAVGKSVKYYDSKVQITMSWSNIKRQTCFLTLIAVFFVHAPYWERTLGFSALLTKQKKNFFLNKQTEKGANADSKVLSHCQMWLYHMCSFFGPAVDTSVSAFFGIEVAIH